MQNNELFVEDSIILIFLVVVDYLLFNITSFDQKILLKMIISFNNIILKKL
jgi:hypothetical protein